jgi:hypothetical protein
MGASKTIAEEVETMTEKTPKPKAPAPIPLPEKPTLYAKTLEIVRTQLGVSEQGGDNRGPEVNEYLREAGVPSGNPWCAALMNWCAKKAADVLGVKSPLEEVPIQAYVQSYFEHFKKKGKIVEAKDAKPGDLIVLFYPSLKRYGHIGIVTSIDLKSGLAYTIEGNTNSAGSREGNVVAAKTRAITPNAKFLRWA